MPTASYRQRRSELETYFDRTAAGAWARLTSDAPVSRIRATVRAGRERMGRVLRRWLPDDLRGRRVLDAGCGTGTLAWVLASRGAEVVAVDLSPTLVGLARERYGAVPGPGRIDFRVGDMLADELGEFDHVVAMDSLIHYRLHDMLGALTALTGRTRASVLFSFAPRTPALAVMHTVGRVFPRRDRAPAIEPVAPARLTARIGDESALADWRVGRSERIASGFYTSEAVELVCP